MLCRLAPIRSLAQACKDARCCMTSHACQTCGAGCMLADS